MSYGTSGAPYMEEAFTMMPGQLNILNLLSSVLGGQIGKGIKGYEGQITPGATPLQEQIFGEAGQWMGRQTPEAAREFWETGLKAPMMETWEKETIPMLREQFIGQGLESSSGLNRALAESGRRLTTDVGSMLEQVLFKGEQALPGQMAGMMGGVAGPQRQIQAELMQEPYMKWQQEQPWANPWLQQLGLGLGTQAFETIAAPKQFQAGLCILATACYGERSDEVNFFRLFRDYVLPQKVIRGYYVFSDVILPLMKFRPVKRLVREMIVNPLVRAGRRMIFHQPHNVKTIFDSGVTVGWLIFWKILGSRGPYRRRTGEVV